MTTKDIKMTALVNFPSNVPKQVGSIFKDWKQPLAASACGLWNSSGMRNCVCEKRCEELRGAARTCVCLCTRTCVCVCARNCVCEDMLGAALQPVQGAART